MSLRRLMPHVALGLEGREGDAMRLGKREQLLVAECFDAFAVFGEGFAQEHFRLRIDRVDEVEDAADRALRSQVWIERSSD